MTTQQTNHAKPLFKLGQTVATPGAIVGMEHAAISPMDLLIRHQCGDWGDLDKEDKQSNDLAVMHDARIFSAYQFDAVKFWVITECDRSTTTILLPEEY
jgi:hypothetical protein